jgi:hypothetical protein
MITLLATGLVSIMLLVYLLSLPDCHKSNTVSKIDSGADIGHAKHEGDEKFSINVNKVSSSRSTLLCSSVSSNRVDRALTCTPHHDLRGKREFEGLIVVEVEGVNTRNVHSVTLFTEKR